MAHVRDVTVSFLRGAPHHAALLLPAGAIDPLELGERVHVVRAVEGLGVEIRRQVNFDLGARWVGGTGERPNVGGSGGVCRVGSERCAERE